VVDDDFGDHEGLQPDGIGIRLVGKLTVLGFCGKAEEQDQESRKVKARLYLLFFFVELFQELVDGGPELVVGVAGDPVGLVLDLDIGDAWT